MGLFSSENLSRFVSNFGNEMFTSALFGVPGMASSFIDRANTAESERRAGVVREDISNIPGYDIPQEAYELRDIYGESAEELLGLKDVVGQATDVARRQTSLTEAPGAGIFREDIRESTASTIESLKQRGGSSTDVLGEIVKAGRGEMDAVRALAVQNQLSRADALMKYQQALTTEAGATAGLITGAAGLEGAGLTGLIQQQGIQYGFERETAENLVNFDIIQYSNWLSQKERESAERAEALNNLLSMGVGSAIGVG